MKNSHPKESKRQNSLIIQMNSFLIYSSTGRQEIGQSPTRIFTETAERSVECVCVCVCGGGGGGGQRQASLKNLSSRAATIKFFLAFLGGLEACSARKF